MTQIHPDRLGLAPWIARKDALVRKVKVISHKYRHQPGRNPKELELWEQLLDDKDVRKLPVATFIRIEEKINTFWHQTI